MKHKLINIISILAALCVLAALPIVMPMVEDALLATVPVTEPAEISTEMTDPPTDPPTQPPTEPQPERFILSFAGDCTLGSTEASWNRENSFVGTVGQDYDYPLANVAALFYDDDFTMVNLEGPLTNGGTPADKQFVFRGKPEYTAILTGVEAVTIANNHVRDYGEQGASDTRAALDAAGIAFGGREESFLYTTESGLTIGVFCDDFAFDRKQIRSGIEALREGGAEVVVCAFHWGEEGVYQPDRNQTDWAHIAIDAGADIVYGTHPHVLQPIEYYGSGVIYYSLGNFCFGGNVNPGDKDTAVIRQEVIREPDGTLRLGETGIIPCSVSSVRDRNNFQPTPMEEGTAEYQRVMDKLSGTYE